MSKSLSREAADRSIRSNVIRISPVYLDDTDYRKQIVRMIGDLCCHPVPFLNGGVITLDNGETLS